MPGLSTAPLARGSSAFQRAALLIAALLALPWIVACGGADASDDDTLTVFAAASLTNAFTALGNAFEAEHPDTVVEFNFAGSQTLATQLLEGAPADVYAAANTVQMSRAAEGGVIEGTPVIFATNRLVIITPADNPADLQSMFDLGNPELKLVVAAEEVPAGRYARQVLDQLAVSEPLLERYPDFDGFNIVSNEVNVLQVVTRVRLGEADAGIVYETDVTPDIAAQLQVLSIIDRFNVTAEYPLAGVVDGDAELAAAFIDFVLSPAGQQILAGWGFAAPAS